MWKLDKQLITKIIANLAITLLSLAGTKSLKQKLIFSTSSEVAVRAFQLEFD